MSDSRFDPLRGLMVAIAFFVTSESPAWATGSQPPDTYGHLPMQFEVNRGQVQQDVRFLARGLGYTIFLTSTEAVLVLSDSGKSTVLRMTLPGSARLPQVSGVDELPGKTNYFIGNEPAKWRSGIPTYAKVRYQDVYPGIDLLYYGRQRALEFDFVLAPAADPSTIELTFEGSERLEIEAEGDLVLHVSGRSIRLRRPVIYQEADGIRNLIDSGYVLKEGDRVGFAVGPYDRSRPLVIDPVVLLYSTFLGGSGFDGVTGVAVDRASNAYVAGFTTSVNFPTTPGAFEPGFHGVAGSQSDAFVAKVNATGSRLLYSTYLGGGNYDYGSSIAVDANGNAYVTGITHSADFPITPGAFQPVTDGSGDLFVTKLDPGGSALVYSTYLGGTFWEFGSDIAVDAAGSAYVTGETGSPDYPTTAGAFQPQFAGGSSGPFAPGPRDAFATKLEPSGAGLVYSTYVGGSGNDYGTGIAVDSKGNAYLTGRTDSTVFPTTPLAFQATIASTGAPSGYNAFATKLNPAGSQLAYSTYLGGSAWDAGSGVAVDRGGNAYVTGVTGSTDFPVTPGAFQTACAGATCADVFVTKLDPQGRALAYSTFLGGAAGDSGSRIAVNALGNAFVTGATSSSDFPVTAAAIQPAYAGGQSDAFVTVLDSSGSRLGYSTFLGGIYRDTGNGIAVRIAAMAYVGGLTTSPNFPVTAHAFQPAHGGGPPFFPADTLSDGFIAKVVGKTPASSVPSTE